MPPSTHTPKPPIDAPDHAASVDPLCAKAVALLGKQRVLHPNVKFAFIDEGSKK